MTTPDIQTGEIVIHGKVYRTVALRLKLFLEAHPTHSIITEMIHALDENSVTIKASIVDAAGVTVATGHAEEIRGDGHINETSALENCETSAVGRALAFAGFGGEHIASADEMEHAIPRQDFNKFKKRIVDHFHCVYDNIDTIKAIQSGMASGDLLPAYEAWDEVDDATKKRLWLAPTKGGVWSTAEYAMFKSDEWGATRKEFHGLTDD